MASYIKYSKNTAILAILFLTACSAGPTKRYVDGKWNVSENICSSDPAQPELGDIRSEIRQSEVHQFSFERKLTFFHLDNTILDVTQKFSRGGDKSGNMKLYDNSSANTLVREAEIRNTRELNNMIDSGFEEFFANDPNIDGKDARSFCLFRGQ